MVRAWSVGAPWGRQSHHGERRTENITRDQDHDDLIESQITFWEIVERKNPHRKCVKFQERVH